MVQNFKEDGGYAGATRLLDLDMPPDGLFVANNLMTVGALEALMDRGVKVPRDLLMVGFDDIPWAKLTRPRLTTVDQPTYQMGRDAGDLLARRLAGNTGPARTIMLNPTIQTRESSIRTRVERGDHHLPVHARTQVAEILNGGTGTPREN